MSDLTARTAGPLAFSNRSTMIDRVKRGCTQKRVIIGCLVLVAILLLCLGFCRKSGTAATVSAASTSTAGVTGTPYSVVTGDILYGIADRNGVTRMEMLFANEETLRLHYEQVMKDREAKYQRALASLSGQDRRFVERVKDAQTLTRREQQLLRRLARRTGFDFRITGYFGNPKYGKMSPANTLTPGMTLIIPAKNETPVDVQETVAAIPGKEFVVVIDDSGSMSDKRMRVAGWYASAAREQGKVIKKVLLYVDGNVRVYDADLNLSNEMRTSGGVENTQEALLEAEDFGGDAVVLITDEEGDDWSTFGRFRLKQSLPALYVEYLHDGQPTELFELAEGREPKGDFKNK